MVTLPYLMIKWIVPSPYFPLVLRNTNKHPAETMMDVGDETTYNWDLGKGMITIYPPVIKHLNATSSISISIYYI